MRTLLALAALSIPAWAAPVPKELRKTNLEQLQGKWCIVSLDSGGGQQVQTGDFAGFTLTIDGDKLSTATTSGAGYNRVAVVWDFEAKPMRIDVQSETSTTPGIFKIDDGRLWWCHAQQNAAAPKDFKGGNGNHCFIWKKSDK